MNESSIANALDAGVVAGGDGIEAQQVGTLAEPVELHSADCTRCYGFGVRPWL